MNDELDIVNDKKVKKITYNRKIASGYKKYSRQYVSRAKTSGVKTIKHRRNFVSSVDNLLKKDYDFFISLETFDINDKPIFKLHYSINERNTEITNTIPIAPIITNNSIINKDTLFKAIDSMDELNSGSKHKYKEKLKDLIIENSVSKFDIKYKEKTNCHLMCLEEPILINKIADRLNITKNMSQRIVAGIKNRIRFPFLYKTPVETPVSNINNLKDLIDLIMVYDLFKLSIPYMKDLLDYFNNEEYTDEEKSDKIADYVTHYEYLKYIGSKEAYETRDSDVNYTEFKRDTFRDIYLDIYSNSNIYIEEFTTFLKNTITYYEEHFMVHSSFEYTIQTFKDRILPFYKFDLLDETTISSMKKNITTYIAKSNKNAKELVKETNNMKALLTKIEESQKLREQFKEIVDNPFIYAKSILNNDNYSQYNKEIKKFIDYNDFIDINDSIDSFSIYNLYIDIFNHNDSFEYHVSHSKFCKGIKELADTLDVKIEIPF